MPPPITTTSVTGRPARAGRRNPVRRRIVEEGEILLTRAPGLQAASPEIAMKMRHELASVCLGGSGAEAP